MDVGGRQLDALEDFAVFHVMFLDDDVDDDELLEQTVSEICRRESHPKVQDFFEALIPQYSPSDFQSHFRLTETLFENLVRQFGANLISENAKNPPISPDKQFAIALWTLGNQESFRDFSGIADRFGVSKSTAWKCLLRTCTVLAENCNQFISWETGIFKNSTFPNTVGCIDVCEIPISAPKENPNSYYNRKQYHSVKLQAVCTDTLKFTDVCIGYCGSMHDARVWRLCELSERIQNDIQAYLPNNTHILGDGAYPLSQFMLTSYRDNGRLTEMQSYYNLMHAKTRSVVERSFALLKGRWRRLNHLPIHDTGIAPLLILAACVAHNICLANEDDPFDDFFQDPNEDRFNDDDIIENVEIAGERKRDAIAAQLYRNRRVLHE